MADLVDQITSGLSRPYFRHILKKLHDNNQENANLLCKHILTEQAEFNIKNSTKEGIRNVLIECWNIYQSDNASISCLHKLNSLKLAKECNESLFRLVAEGPCLVYLKELEERLARFDNKKEDN
jgi:hypothetical protein